MVRTSRPYSSSRGRRAGAWLLKNWRTTTIVFAVAVLVAIPLIYTGRTATIKATVSSHHSGLMGQVLTSNSTNVATPAHLGSRAPLTGPPAVNPGIANDTYVYVNESGTLVPINATSLLANLSYSGVYNEAPPVSPGPNSNHWWSGMLYGGYSPSQTTVQVTMTIPNDLPPGGDCVYQGVLSAYDSVVRYDQIGFDDFYNGCGSGGPAGTDNWGITWAALPNCGSGAGAAKGVNYDYDVAALYPGNQYTFRMDISLGTVTYSVYQIIGSVSFLYWSSTYFTGGTYFSIAPSVYCNGQYWAGFTDYEESYYTVQQTAPNWDIFYSDTTAGGTGTAAWVKFINGPVPPGVDGNLYGTGPSLTNINEDFTLNLSSYYWTTTPGGTIITNAVVTNQQTTLCAIGGTNCAITAYTSPIHPTGWGISFVPLSSFNPPTGATMTIHVPSGWPCATYDVIQVKAYSAPLTEFTTVRLTVLVACHSGSGSGGYGGGCVNTNTPIATPSGYVKVQNLLVGQQITGWNFTSGSSVIETVHNLTPFSVSTMLSINGGRLRTTPVDQPVWIRNATFQGVLWDPQNLTLQDIVWDEVNQTWFPVTSLAFVTGSTTVYDIATTTSPHDYSAAGVLSMSKYCGQWCGV